MAEISTAAPITTRHIDLPRPRFPWRAIGASIAAMPGAIGRAFAMAYVDPYAHPHHRRLEVSDEKLDGRDPDW